MGIDDPQDEAVALDDDELAGAGELPAESQEAATHVIDDSRGRR
jgi:hypothetical protein